MTETTGFILAVLILILSIVVTLQSHKLTQQQAQIFELQKTQTEFMVNMTKFVSAQNDSNEAVINTLDLDAQQNKLMYNAVLALGKHVEYLDITVQEMKGE